MRGTQVTNAEGIAEFTTIYPGWSRGRTDDGDGYRAVMTFDVSA